ncbi:MAG: hypothetical protein EOM25_14775, partial [Deltaproteobacteria bacterium]|nr:hypothetical protein [Deltaproteobacteria bacterium]
MNDHQHAFDRRHSSDSGSALVAIIITMVVISALTVAVVSLNSSGVMNTVTFNHNKNAYYLAESGYRYAAAVYLNTENDDSGGSADDEKASALARQIDGTTYTLPGGRFELSAFPYWLVPNARYTRGQTATLNFPGTIPPSFSIPSSGTMAFSHIREDGTPEITLFIYSGASINSGTNTLRCTLGNRLPTNAAYAIEADDMV